MTDDKDRKDAAKRSQISGAGRSGSARSIGEELGELDFEPDALLDSLLSDEPPAVSEAPAVSAGPPLIQPDKRLFSEDEDTHVGSLEAMGLRSSMPSAEIDALLDQAAPPTEAPPPEGVAPPGRGARTASGEIDALLDDHAPVPPAAAAPPRPRPPRPPPPRPPAPAAAPAPPPPAPVPVQADPFAGAFDDDLDFEALDLRADAPLLESEATPPRGTPVATLRAAVPSRPDHPIEDLGEEHFDELADAPTVVGDISEIDALLAAGSSPGRLTDDVTDAPVAEPEVAEAFAEPQAEFEQQAEMEKLVPPPPSFGTPAIEAEASALSDDEAQAILDSLPPESASGGDADALAPASAFLANQGNLEVWRARAEWMENEAQARTDAESKARGLTVAAELWALTGDLERAREVISEAHAVHGTSPVVQRQSRHLTQATDDWKGAAALLESEARSAPQVSHRAHAHYFAAEIHRLKLDDVAASQRKLDTMLRGSPEDCRSAVAKLASQLAESAAPPKLRPPVVESIPPLAAAVATLGHLRGGPAPSEPSAVVHGETLRRSANAGDRDAAGDAARALAALPELGSGALWLAASLYAPSHQTRGKAISALSELLRKEPSASAARRALAARALEQGDADALTTALADAEGDDVVSPADRVALAALTGGGREALTPWLPAIERIPQLAALASAAASTAAPTSAPPASVVGSDAARSAIALGRALSTLGVEGVDPTLLPSALEGFVATHGDGSAGKRLALELQLRAKDGASIAKAMVEEADALAPDVARDELLAAAVAYEVSDSGPGATAALRQALALDPGSEASARALLQHLPPEDASEVLAGVADAAADDIQRALLLLEAALRSNDTAAAESLITRAAELAPALPYAYRIGEERARRAGDVDKLVEWLRMRRAVSEDPIERSWDAVREALLTADDDREAASTLLAESISARPGDIALRELHERMIPSAGDARAEWREEAAALAEGDDQAALLLEAALEFERSGNLTAASAAAGRAKEHGGLAELAAERLAAYGPAAAIYAEKWLGEAKESTDPAEQRALYTRLARLDRLRGEGASALLWDAATIESDPQALPALHRLAHEYLSGARLEDLAPIADKLSDALSGPEAMAQAFVAILGYERSENSEAAQSVLERVASGDDAPLWALRQLAATAAARGDDATGLTVNRALAERANRAIDAATLSLRAAEAGARTGNLEVARALLERALELLPEHPTALAAEVLVLERLGDFAGAAQALEAIAASSLVQQHQLEAWHAAACLWLDKVEDADRGLAALEKAAEIELTYSDLFERLRAQYVAREDRSRLASLLERRLDQTDDPEERVALEVTRGRALAAVGDREAARTALAAALDENPDHVDALDAFADLSVQESDWEGAEQSLIRLARSVNDSGREVEIYRRLGALYDEQLPNPQRAELAYKEILKRVPSDVLAQQSLVFVYGRLGERDKAVEMATELVNEAATPDDKRDRTLALARVYEEVLEDKRKAETTLDRARKTWPQDGAVLKALAEFYQRHGENTALNVLLDRAANDARRALSTGRFDPGLFSQLATVAELRGGAGAAQVAHATLAAIEGRVEPLMGAGAGAADPKLDELMAPELLTLPMRALLKKSADALDAAYAVDPKTMRAAPLPQESAQIQREIEQLAARFGIAGMEVLVSPTIGAQALPMSTMPPRLIVGTELLSHSDPAQRDFLLVRALKIIQANACTLSRTSPIDLWPTLAGYLSIFAPNWQAPNVDARKQGEARERIQRAITRRLDDDVPVLALEVIGSIGNRASQVATAIHQWGDRVGLLAVGSPATAFDAIALSAGHPPPPESGADRVKWILRNPEARDLAVFSVSEQYAAARRQIGVDG